MKYNKKISIKYIFIPVILILLFFFLIITYYEPIIIGKDSYFSDFKVRKNKVYLFCDIKLVNRGIKNKSFCIVANFTDDEKHKLLTNSYILGLDTKTSRNKFTLKKLSTKHFRVVFIGKFGGNAQKQNRELPFLEVV